MTSSQEPSDKKRPTSEIKTRKDLISVFIIMAWIILFLAVFGWMVKAVVSN